MLLKLPVAQSRFRKLREAGYLYVDKTNYAYELITSGEQYYFLSRPRRFGKSLLISMLAELLGGHKQYFTDLWITQSDYVWREYGVIKLDFSAVSADNPVDFKRNLCEALADIIDSYQLGITVDFSHPEGALGRLARALYQRLGLVAILIDEYDDPLTQLMHRPEQAQALRDVMQRFFKYIKSLEDYVNFVLITGVSAFSKAGLFSGINNLQMLTLDQRFATICGYTEAEIDTFFEPYLQAWASKQSLATADLRQNLKDWYNGYHFSASAPAVYNPYSFTNAVHKQQIDNFWIETGNPRFLLEELRKTARRSELQLLQPEQLEVSKHTLGIFEIEQIPLAALMFQAGYLTLASFDANTKLFRLKYPNLEVKSTLEKYLLTICADLDFSDTDKLTTKFKTALDQQNLVVAGACIQGVFAKVPYQLHVKAEAFYHALLLTLCNAAEVKCQAEVATSQGRIDLVLELPQRLYIVELKFNQTSQAALAQIENCRYWEPFVSQPKPIVLWGLNITKTAGQLNLSYMTKDYQP